MVETLELPKCTPRFPSDIIQKFMEAAFNAAGFSNDHARLAATVLISADLWGIRSHGVARLPFFIDLIESGALNTKSNITFQAKSDTTGVLDADNGSGIVASNTAMDKAIGMAEKHGTGFIAVCNSTHFAFPGYWTRRRSTWSYRYLYEQRVNYDTNVPHREYFRFKPFKRRNSRRTGRSFFYLDMATAVVARGKNRNRFTREKAYTQEISSGSIS